MAYHPQHQRQTYQRKRRSSIKRNRVSTAYGVVDSINIKHQTSSRRHNNGAPRMAWHHQRRIGGVMAYQAINQQWRRRWQHGYRRQQNYTCNIVIGVIIVNNINNQRNISVS